MKKSELIEKLEAIKELKAAEMKHELAELIEQIRPAHVSDGTKLHHFVQINERVEDPAVKYPRQMLVCHDILKEHVGEVLERAEVLELIEARAEELKTRQSPERIYAFYQKRMEDEGWLTRKKERIAAEA